MSSLPASGYLSDAARTVGEQKQALEDVRDFIAQGLGGATETELTIVSGAVTPTTGIHSIDTEADAATDDLTNILQTNLQDGQMLLLRPNNAGRDIVVKNAAGGTGQVFTTTAADVTLSGTDSFMWVQRRGAAWYEIQITKPVDDIDLSAREAIKTYTRFAINEDLWEAFNRNQQWGGDNFPFQMPDGTVKMAATGYLKGGTGVTLGASAANEKRGMGFKVPNDNTVQYKTLRVKKVGSPADNLQLQIDTDSAGLPSGTPITNGTATAISGKTIGTEYSDIVFSFAVNPSQTGSTQYHLNVSRSGAVDAANYYVIDGDASSDYPHGGLSTYNAGWSATAGYGIRFTSITTEASAPKTEGILRSTQRSKFSVERYFNHKSDFSIPLQVTIAEKDKTIFDVGVGADNSRIRLSTAVTTGYAVLELWDSAGTKSTITGAADITGAAKLITIKARCAGDGSDYLKLYVGETEQGTSLTAQTFAFDEAFAFQHMTLLGGWPDAPTMSSITLTDGDGSATGLSLNNTTGHYHELKFTPRGGETTTWTIEDGTKKLTLIDNGYYLDIDAAALYAPYGRTYNNSEEITLKVWCKGSDYTIYLNGSLLVDGTGLLTVATANNQVTVNGNPGQVDFAKYTATDNPHDQLTTSSATEIATIERDIPETVISSIYNAGTPKTFKNYFGLGDDTIGNTSWTVELRGIESGPTKTGITKEPIPDLAGFYVGEFIIHHVGNYQTNVGGRYIYSGDLQSDAEVLHQFSTANYANNIATTIHDSGKGMTYNGPTWYTNADTLTAHTIRRKVVIQGGNK